MVAPGNYGNLQQFLYIQQTLVRRAVGLLCTWFLDRLLWATLCADKIPWAQPGVARSSKVEGWREEGGKKNFFFCLI